ncbi:hypothetical protein [Candidatus Kuenenia stuttgartiensis]
MNTKFVFYKTDKRKNISVKIRNIFANLALNPSYRTFF